MAVEKDKISLAGFKAHWLELQSWQNFKKISFGATITFFLKAKFGLDMKLRPNKQKDIGELLLVIISTLSFLCCWSISKLIKRMSNDSLWDHGS